MTAVRQVRQLLDSLGLNQVQIWSCENGTWAYQPTNQPYQTQSEQARSLIQRYVFNIDLGLNKLFWNNLMEWIDFGGIQGNIFNSMGLIGDGMRNSEPPQNFNMPRVNYFSYKLLSEAIDIDRARYAGKLSIHQEPILYAYKYTPLTSDSLGVFILWRDTGIQSVTFHINTQKALVTNMITDSLGNILQRDTVTADVQGNITFNVGIDALLVKAISSTTSVEDEGENIPIEFMLYQNYPNPFNPSTTIELKLNVQSDFTLTIFDVLGRKVRAFDYQRVPAGTHKMEWDGKDDRGRQSASGVYLYCVQAGQKVETQRMLLLK